MTFYQDLAAQWTKAQADTYEHLIIFWETFGKTDFDDRSFLDDEVKNSFQAGIPPRDFPWGMLLVLTFYLLIIHWTYRLFIVRPASWFILSAFAKRRSSVEKRVDRMTQAHIELINYSLFSYLGYKVVLSQPWALYFDGSYTFSAYWFTNQPNPWIFGKELIFFYVLYAARYLQAFISVFLESKKKDFYEMQLHHAVTFCLVLASFYNGRLKGGLMTMVLMDFADPPLHFGKHFVYLRDVSSKRYSKIFGVIGDSSFVLFILDFVVTRIIMFPYLVWSTVQGNVSIYLQDPDVHLLSERGLRAFPLVCGIEETILLILLNIMVGLQVFWLTMIIKQAVNVLSGNKLGDQRSDSESDTKKTN